MFQDLHLTPQRQASIYATAVLVLLFLGTLASILLVIAAAWFVLELFALILFSAIECCELIGQTFQMADPMIRFLILVVIGLVLYRTFKHFRR